MSDDKIQKAIALAEYLCTTHVTSDKNAADVIDDLVDGVLEMQKSIKTLLENNDRLTKAINEMPEWERGVKAAIAAGEDYKATIIDEWSTLTDEQRLSFLERLPCCRHCGSLDTGCQCWNDE